ncbi:hypothetical protein PXH66_11370 [Synoicihabitans lomoniglobus]|uniref:Uncharacterized protein n=2 Tax=Synoicihabitans lomoniglobus TaxID=2909285 RepID=A0AAF0CST3_9BACT|nr:hypothetical protein PXH66_11370 [Opitutaceae bacterium LMO-M01]
MIAAGLGIICLGVFCIWRWWPAEDQRTEPVSQQPSPATEDDQIEPRASISAPVSGDRPNPENDGEPPVPSTEIYATIAENTIPGRMVFLEIEFNRNGPVRLVGAVGAAGRAKTPPLRQTPGQLRYEILDATGQVTVTGSLADPVNQRLEHPSSDDPQRMTTTRVDHEQSRAILRVPGESRAHRIRFQRLGLADDATSMIWTLIADLPLQPSP